MVSLVVLGSVQEGKLLVWPHFSRSLTSWVTSSSPWPYCSSLLLQKFLNISRMMQQTKDYYNSIQPVLLLPYGFRILVCFGIIPHFPLLIYLTNFCTWPAYSLMVLKDVKYSPRHLSTTTRGNQTQRFSRMIMTTLTIKILDKLWSLATHSSLLDIGIVFVNFIIQTF